MKRLVLSAAIALTVLVLAGIPAGAESSGDVSGNPGGATVRDVDTRQYPTVRLDVLVGGPAQVSDFNVRENGVLVRNPQVQPLKQTTNPVGTVLVIDTSGSMKSQGAIDQAKAAARQFIASKAGNDWIALVSFSSQALIRSDFTQDGAALAAAVDGLDAVGETALWDGLSLSARLYDKRPDLQPNVVLLSDGSDTISAGTERDALAALSGVHATVFAVGIASSEFDPASLAGVVKGSGGSLSTSANPADLTAQFSRIRAAIENQYEVVYTSSGQGGSLSVELTVGSDSTEVATRAGSSGVAAPPKVVKRSRSPFRGAVGRYLIPLLAMLGAGRAEAYRKAVLEQLRAEAKLVINEEARRRGGEEPASE
jgi:VWFA-related protein